MIVSFHKKIAAELNKMAFYSVSANKAHVQNLANSKRKNTIHCKISGRK
jgi:hypothetical protein